MVVMLLSSYPLDLWTVMNCGRRADPVQSNFFYIVFSPLNARDQVDPNKT